MNDSSYQELQLFFFFFPPLLGKERVVCDFFFLFLF